MGVSAYPFISSVKAGDRVALLPQGRGHVVLGAIGGGAVGGRLDSLEGRTGSLEGRTGSLEGRTGSLETKTADSGAWTVASSSTFGGGLTTRKIGPIVVIQGAAAPSVSSGTFSSGFETIGTVAAGHRPGSTLYVPISTNTGQDFQAEVSVSGDISIRTLAGSRARSTNNSFSLSGNCWTVG